MNYWERLYSKGGNSGCGSVGSLRDWKWTVLRESGANLNSVIDVGCGDLSFWEGKTCDNYLGIEQSESRCGLNRDVRPDLPCICFDASVPAAIGWVPTVLCFDVLFHVMDTEDYTNILENLSRCSSKHIFVYTWFRNPFLERNVFLKALATQMYRRNYPNAMHMLTAKEPHTDFEYQCYRDFLSFGKHLPGFVCTDIKIPPASIDQFGAMYIFRRIE